ncbi:hypothetical protein BU23DRAFT_552396 [Bimuria novae-zelandiae CBS 107.79]|uniref:Uncharacterized protein n=1 Tax=Bimuria novae-zelandiae CBS 107.79 TaxID=1447943 RepID=A0A6A5VG93_9PLEO|nr:hypothetical protein BU23DRAFT_552396 [Bimuria novae-zelandiae CBS 107.79]
MPVYQILSTTPRLDERIYEVAASLHSEPDGEAVELAKGGKVVRYSRSEESTALDREYFTNVWPNIQQAEKEVKLEVPKHKPTVFRLENGWLSTSPNEVGTIIPIRNRDDTFEDRIDIESAEGESYRDLKLAPRTMVVLSGDVRFRISDRVPFDLILHPTSPVRKVNLATVEGT